MQREGGMSEKTAEQLRNEEVRREVLESAAQRLERETGNQLYMQAWKKAARMLRDLKSC